MNADKKTKLLVDTNVWLDRYIVDRSGHAEALAFLTTAYASGALLLFPATCACDVFFSICSEFKRSCRRESGVVTEQDVHTIRRIAWGCVDNMRELATVVGMDESDLWLACKHRALTWDLEDNVVLAAAERAEADYLVTNDRSLIQHATIAALTPADMKTVLEA